MRYEDVKWEHASCVGINTDLFFMENPAEAALVGPTIRRMCAECPILAECREYAIWHERQGFWGGLTARERDLIRAKSRRASRAA